MARSKEYWDDHNAKYPHQTEVPHRSAKDPDPRKVHQLIGGGFLRVPFDGIAHWGFRHKGDLESFERLIAKESV